MLNVKPVNSLMKCCLINYVENNILFSFSAIFEIVRYVKMGWWCVTWIFPLSFIHHRVPILHVIFCHFVLVNGKTLINLYLYWICQIFRLWSSCGISFVWPTTSKKNTHRYYSLLLLQTWIIVYLPVDVVLFMKGRMRGAPDVWIEVMFHNIE